MNNRSEWIFWKISLIFSMIVSVLSCDFAGGPLVAEMKIPEIPETLRVLAPAFYWEVRGTCVETTMAHSGQMVQVKSSRHAEGDWILAIPRYKDSGVERSGEESAMPALGWVSHEIEPAENSAGILLDTAGGLAAAVLDDVQRASGVWAGINLTRLLSNFRTKGLDTTNVEYGKLVDGLLNRDISIYDIGSKTKYLVTLALPEGNWLGGWGTLKAQLPNGGGDASLELYLGINYLIRESDGAGLHISLFKNPRGILQVNSVMHEKKAGESLHEDSPAD